MKCSNCEKELTTNMEVEYSAWLTEFFCSSKCATDRYFNYMESTPVDFENLPDSLVVVGNKLEAAEQTLAPDGGEALLNYDPLPDIERISKQGYVSPAAGKA